MKIEAPTTMQAAGQPPKLIKEFVGLQNTPDTSEISIAHMISPEGWSEPGQCPEFDEFTVVLAGELRIETRESTFTLKQDQAYVAKKGEWIRYSTRAYGGAEYIAVCRPAFSQTLVHRD